MLRVSNIKLSIDDDKSKIKSCILKKLKIKEKDLKKYFIYKESIDARKRGKIDFVYTVDVVANNESKLLKKKLKDVVEIKQREYIGVDSGTQELKNRPVKRYDEVVTGLLGAIVGAIGAVIARLFIK